MIYIYAPVHACAYIRMAVFPNGAGGSVRRDDRANVSGEKGENEMSAGEMCRRDGCRF